MSTTQEQIEKIARECAEDCNGRTTEYKAETILAAANRIFDLRKDEYARQYAALKVQESGAVPFIEGLPKTYGYENLNWTLVWPPDSVLAALRAIIADGTPQAKG